MRSGCPRRPRAQPPTRRARVPVPRRATRFGSLRTAAVAAGIRECFEHAEPVDSTANTAIAVEHGNGLVVRGHEREQLADSRGVEDRSNRLARGERRAHDAARGQYVVPRYIADEV